MPVLYETPAKVFNMAGMVIVILVKTVLEYKMERPQKTYETRSAKDRRSSVDRRIVNLGPQYPGLDMRKKRDRRQGWEDRYGWERTSRWSSAPIFSKSP